MAERLPLEQIEEEEKRRITRELASAAMKSQAGRRLL